MNFQSCCCNPKTTFTDRPSKYFLEIANRSLDYRILPGIIEEEAMWPPGTMAGVEDQNSARRRPVWTGEVVRSDKGLTMISFWGLDGGVAWSAGAGGGRPAGTPLLSVFPVQLGPARASSYVAVLRSSTRTRGRGEGTRGRPEKGARQWQRWRDRRRTEEKRRRIAVRSFDSGAQTARHERV
jgi:hypothetical protein